MMNNSNQNSYSNYDTRGPAQNRNTGFNRQPPVMPADLLDGTKEYDPVEAGRKFVDAVDKRSFTTSQLRQILSSAAIVKNRIDRENAASDLLSTDIQQEIQYLKLKLIYQMGRDNGLKRAFSGENGINLPAVLQNVGDSKENFNRFYRLLESIVAYRKFAGGDS